MKKITSSDFFFFFFFPPVLQIPAPGECKASSGLVDQEGRQPVADFNKALLTEGTEAQFWHHVPTSEAPGSTSPPPPITPPTTWPLQVLFPVAIPQKTRRLAAAGGRGRRLRRPPSPLIKGGDQTCSPSLLLFFFFPKAKYYSGERRRSGPDAGR